LAKFDAVATDIDVSRTFYQRANIAITFATEGTKSIFLGGASTAAISAIVVTYGGHLLSF
jgi:hypothetical protein